MHTIHLEGGLGNQLFMVFAVMSHAFKHKSSFYIEDVKIQTGTRKKTYWDSFLKPLKPFCKNMNPEKLNMYREPCFHYTEIPPFHNDIHVKMTGYYQSYKYFHEYRDEIFKLIELEKRKEEVRQKLNRESSSCWDTTVSMHFRIGDYKKLPQYHQVLPLQYYKNALTGLMQNNNNVLWTVLYFCEDEDVEEVAAKVNALSVDFPTMKFERMAERGLEDWEEILAMSLCRHHIIANSSFSYFGAYFNNNTRGEEEKEVQVYYPSVWFGPALADKNTKDICPPNWIKVTM